MRFGQPSKASALKQLMRYSSIAKLTGVPYSTVRNYCLKYESSQSATKPKATNRSTAVIDKSKYVLE